MLLPKKKCSALRLWIWKIDLSEFSWLPIMLIGNWATEIITQSCFHTLYFQKYIMKNFWNSLPKEAVSLPLNSSILLWERSHLSKYVVWPRWSKEVKLDTFGQNSPTHHGNGKISRSPSRNYGHIPGVWPGWRGAMLKVQIDGPFIWELFPTASCC